MKINDSFGKRKKTEKLRESYSGSMEEIEVKISVIEQVKQQNAEALSRLYDEYAPALTGVISRILSDQSMLQDVLQLSFVEIWNQAPEYNASSGNFFLWMIKIAREQASQANGEVKPESSTKVFSENGSGDVSAESAQQALDLVYFKGYSLEHASELLRFDVDTLMHMIRKKLKTYSQKKNG